MIQRALPWVGLLLLASSFVWFVRLPAPEPQPLAPLASHKEKSEPLVVVLDPGHGGEDSGAMCGAVMEKDLTLDVALRAELLLRSTGIRTVLTRADDRYVSLAERAAAGNGEEHSLFVSIHFNDGERSAASGVETYFAERQSPTGPGIFAWLSFLQPAESKPLLGKSESLARFLQSALVDRTRAVNRGTKSAQFYVIANVRNPAALVEGGFITNPADVTKLTTANYREAIAAAIADGIHHYQEALRPAEPTLAWAESASE
jgi:N-acetylmuramoyl-L-alanine amidase